MALDETKRKNTRLPIFFLMVFAIVMTIFISIFVVRYILLKQADQYYLKGEYQKAYDAYLRLSDDMADTIREMHPLVASPIGSAVIFGHYEQDGVIENGKEPIEWTLLHKEANGVLLFSNKILECRPFEESSNNEGDGYRDIYIWLNDDFFYNAFSAEEQNKIKRYDSKTQPYQMNLLCYPVFLMELVSMEEIYHVSYKEVKGVQASHSALEGIQTEYVKNRYPYNAGRWWVDGGGLLIKGDGSLGSSEKTDGNVGVRPMIWLEQ